MVSGAGILNFIGKLGNTVTAPFDILKDWANEPLKRWEHERNEQSHEHAHQREMDKLLAEEKIRSELRIEEEKAKTDIEIQRETGILRIVAEIEDLKKDKQLERMKEASAALVHYQSEMMRLMTDIVYSIGEMQLDLRERAQKIVLEKTTQYKEIQSNAYEEMAREIEEIEDRFESNERAKNMLYAAIDRKYNSILDATTSFLAELSRDIGDINRSITGISESGKIFVEQHLSQFNNIGITTNTIRSIE
ncbi:hypothetical protein [Insolitispirillum peregrinum]|uniref:hypothetical protein n=1 Tax=Insolitispirillum peregrinum TaxID=80876 RepID=UPI0036135890